MDDGVTFQFDGDAVPVQMYTTPYGVGYQMPATIGRRGHKEPERDVVTTLFMFIAVLALIILFIYIAQRYFNIKV